MYSEQIGLRKCDKIIPEAFGKNSLIAVINVFARALYVDQLMQCSTENFPFTASFLLPASMARKVQKRVSNDSAVNCTGESNSFKATFGLKRLLLVLGGRLFLRNAFGLAHFL